MTEWAKYIGVHILQVWLKKIFQATSTLKVLLRKDISKILLKNIKRFISTGLNIFVKFLFIENALLVFIWQTTTAESISKIICSLCYYKRQL